MRVLVSRVTIDDCVVQTFRASGPGGQKRNVTDSSVRVIHKPSGARGQAVESRYQLRNKRMAFRRMAESPEFQAWARVQAGEEPPPEASSPRRVRTYNLVERRVVDHRTGARTSKVDEVLDGNLDLLDG